MGKISTYSNDGTISPSDKLIGTDSSDNNATKNFLVGDLLSYFNSLLGAQLVLNAQSTLIQAPSDLDTPLQVTFGGAQGSPSTPVQIDASGNITFNQSGLYFINAYGSVERVGSSGGTAIFLFRGLLNNNPATTVKAFHLDTPNIAFPYEITVPFQANAGDVFKFQVMRDSSGVNHGGLYPHTNLGGWANTPSTEVLIWKVDL